jgi:hypothetical protein
VTRPARVLAALLLAAAAAFSPAAPALAETIHLKNGTQVTGKIVKEDAKTFSVDTPDGRRKIPKEDVAVRPAPDPLVAAVVGLVPGAGLFYTGDLYRGAFFLGTSGAVGAAVYLATRQIRPSSPSTAAVAAIVGAEVVGLLGAWDAFNHAHALAAETRYHIDYD